MDLRIFTMKEDNDSKQIIKDKQDFQRWLSGIPYEVAFWRSYYGNKRRRADLFSWSLYDKPCHLDNFDIGKYVDGLETPRPKLLDVGCALSYMFSSNINGKHFDVDYVDPLAPFYNQILRRYRIERPEIQFGMIESLTGSYAPNTVDFIHVRNALDHCSNPLNGIIQALAALKKNGVLYLNHFRNEAKNEGYRGFHQFNINEKDGDFILWNKDIELNVTEICKGFAEVTTTVTAEGRIVSVLTKKAEVSSTLYNPQEIAMLMTSNMMATVEYFHKFRSSSKYQTKRIISTIGHRTMRMMPYSILNKIKRLAGK
ncbi:MAG: class I SAM-dependent methyltransferase [Muribaculaceae bacterium]|nr:class I SAM-dependent methyltransferase [Muribaculaceae bacterium]